MLVKDRYLFIPIFTALIPEKSIKLYNAIPCMIRAVYSLSHYLLLS